MAPRRNNQQVPLPSVENTPVDNDLEQPAPPPPTSDTGGMARNEARVLWAVVGGIGIVMVSVVVAAIFALGAMVASSAAQKQASYEQLQNQVQSLNDKVDNLNTQISQLKSALGK